MPHLFIKEGVTYPTHVRAAATLGFHLSAGQANYPPVPRDERERDGNEREREWVHVRGNTRTGKMIRLYIRQTTIYKTMTPPPSKWTKKRVF